MAAGFPSSLSPPSFSSPPLPAVAAALSTSVQRAEFKSIPRSGSVSNRGVSVRHLTSLSRQLSCSRLQVGAELVGVCGRQHLLHARKLAAGLQVDAAAHDLLLGSQRCRLLPGPPPVEEGTIRCGTGSCSSSAVKSSRTWRILQTRHRSERRWRRRVRGCRQLNLSERT